MILLHAYFGFDGFREIRKHIPSLREEGIIIIEDITHSLFNAVENLEAAYFVASLRKWIGIPEGEIAFSSGPPHIPPTIATQDKVVELNLQALQENSSYRKSIHAKSKEKYLGSFNEMEREVNTDIDFNQMSNMFKRIFLYTDFRHLKEARKGHYLRNELKDIKYLKLVFQSCLLMLLFFLSSLCAKQSNRVKKCLSRMEFLCLSTRECRSVF